jgi:hypothetical protein
LLNKHPQTAQQISDDVKDRLQTRQDPLRVVSFYLSTWKKAGWVRIVGTAEGPVSTGSSKPPTPSRDIETIEASDVGSISVEELAGPQLTDDDGFDYVNATPADAILNVMQSFADPVAPRDVASELTVRGYSIDAKKARDVMRRLVEKGQLAKTGEGQYELSTPVGR